MNFSNDIPGPETIKVLGWEKLEARRARSKAKKMYKVLNKSAPSSLVKLFKYEKEFTQYDLRGSCTALQLPQPKIEKLKKFFLRWSQNLEFLTTTTATATTSVHLSHGSSSF